MIEVRNLLVNLSLLLVETINPLMTRLGKIKDLWSEQDPWQYLGKQIRSSLIGTDDRTCDWLLVLIYETKGGGG